MSTLPWPSCDYLFRLIWKIFSQSSINKKNSICLCSKCCWKLQWPWMCFEAHPLSPPHVCTCTMWRECSVYHKWQRDSAATGHWLKPWPSNSTRVSPSHRGLLFLPVLMIQLRGLDGPTKTLLSLFMWKFGRNKNTRLLTEKVRFIWIKLFLFCCNQNTVLQLWQKNLSFIMTFYLFFFPSSMQCFTQGSFS